MDCRNSIWHFFVKVGCLPRRGNNGTGPFLVHSEWGFHAPSKCFLQGRIRNKLPVGTGGRPEISLICEGQYNQSIQDLPLSWRRSVKAVNLPPERAASVSFPQNLIGLEYAGTGAGLDPAGCQPRCTRGCPPRGPLPGPTVHCEARHLERRVSARQVSARPQSFVPSWGRPNPDLLLASLPFSCHGPDSRRWDYRPTYPGRELSSWRGSGSLRSRGALRGGIAGPCSLQLEGSLGPRERRLPSADLPGYRAAWAGGRGGGQSL